MDNFLDQVAHAWPLISANINQHKFLLTTLINYRMMILANLFLGKLHMNFRRHKEFLANQACHLQPAYSPDSLGGTRKPARTTQSQLLDQQNPVAYISFPSNDIRGKSESGSPLEPCIKESMLGLATQGGSSLSGSSSHFL